MAFCGTDPVRAKIVIDDTVLEQANNFEYLGYCVSYNAYNDIANKLHKFNPVSYTHLDVYKRQLSHYRKKIHW